MKDIGFLSYYERGPPYGLIFGLIFGISIPIIIIIFVVYCLCVRQKSDSPRKPPQPIVNPSARSRAEHSKNSYTYTTAETIPLQTRNETETTSPKEDELAKGEWFRLYIMSCLSVKVVSILVIKSWLISSKNLEKHYLGLLSCVICNLLPNLTKLVNEHMKLSWTAGCFLFATF